MRIDPRMVGQGMNTMFGGGGSPMPKPSPAAFNMGSTGMPRWAQDQISNPQATMPTWAQGQLPPFMQQMQPQQSAPMNRGNSILGMLAAALAGPFSRLGSRMVGNTPQLSNRNNDIMAILGRR